MNFKFIYKEDLSMRVDKYITSKTKDYTRTYIQQVIKDGNCLVNGSIVKTNYMCKLGDKIIINIPSKEENIVEAENIPLEIVYEDHDILIVNKARGMVVHPATSHFSGTLVNAIKYHCGDQLSNNESNVRPGIVHRIDKDTTGLLIVCKNDITHESIAKQLKKHNIHRVYEAIVYNNIKEDAGTIRSNIGRKPSDRKKMAVTELGKLAITHFNVKERLFNNSFTYIECKLETGRTHQIRVHMANRGNPILGDSIYGPKSSPFNLKGQLLHAKELGFIHPRTGEKLLFTSNIPEDFQSVLNTLRSKTINHI